MRTVAVSSSQSPVFVIMLAGGMSAERYPLPLAANTAKKGNKLRRKKAKNPRELGDGVMQSPPTMCLIYSMSISTIGDCRRHRTI